MRVGHVIESSRLSDGGPSSALLALCEALADSDCHSEVACRHSDWAGVTVGRTRMVVLPQRLWGNRVSIRAFAQGVDVLHLHGLWDSLPAAAGKYAAQAGIPYVVSLHGMLLRRSLAHHRLRKRLFLAAVGRKILAGAAALHFTTQAELDHAAAMLPVGPRRVVIPLTVESRLLAGLPESVQWREFFPGIPDSWPRLLFLSRIHPVKNLPALIAALPPLIKEFPGLHLVVAGSGDPGYIRRVHRLVEDASLAGHVYFLGLVGGEAKLALLRSATIIAIPSFHESFGMALAEGLACGVPVLVTPEIGLRQEILASSAGIMCDESPSSIAESLAIALRDPNRLRLAGVNGRRWAIGTLSPSVVSQKFMDVYDSAIAQRSGPK